MRTTRKSKILWNGNLIETYQELKNILKDFSLDACDVIFSEYKIYSKPRELSLVDVYNKYKEFDNSGVAKTGYMTTKDEYIKNSNNYQVCQLKNKNILVIDRNI